MESDQEEKQEQEEKEPGKEERSVLKEDLNQFQCLACPGQVTLFSFFADLENHFLCIHKVSDLLTGPATSALLKQCLVFKSERRIFYVEILIKS